MRSDAHGTMGRCLRPPTSPPTLIPGFGCDCDPAVRDRLKRDDHGLFPAVAQDAETGQVLMVGWMDDEALRRTLTSGRMTYFSRSRADYWRKGDTSGNVQWVREVRLDCDGDTVLVRVDQIGPACHTGQISPVSTRAIDGSGGSR